LLWTAWTRWAMSLNMNSFNCLSTSIWCELIERSHLHEFLFVISVSFSLWPGWVSFCNLREFLSMTWVSFFLWSPWVFSLRWMISSDWRWLNRFTSLICHELMWTGFFSAQASGRLWSRMIGSCGILLILFPHFDLFHERRNFSTLASLSPNRPSSPCLDLIQRHLCSSPAFSWPARVNPARGDTSRRDCLRFYRSLEVNSCSHIPCDLTEALLSLQSWS
jgi:hypothetical protein